MSGRLIISIVGLSLGLAACSSGSGGVLPGQSGAGGTGAGGIGAGSAAAGGTAAGASGGTSGGGSGTTPACTLPSGVAPAPTSFALPAARCNTQFDAAANDAGIDYTLLDLASQGHPDLTVTRDDCDSTVGQSHWDVYPWSASGFAPTPRSFTVPAARCKTRFDAAANDAGIDYTLLDLASQGHPDLTVTRDDCDSTVGQSHWDVYPWSASGFAPTPRSFTVPAARCNTEFDATANDAGIDYALLDLASQGHPDLTVTRDDCDSTVGQSHWDVYPWSASGFAPTPRSFTVPAARCNTEFDAAANDAGIDYTLLDLGSKGHPDLIVTRDDCDSTVGQSHWDVYPWSASGFAATPRSFALPAARCNTEFDATASHGALGYAVVDLASSGEPDLVVFHDDCDPSVGKTHWDVYPATPSGFAATPVPFAIPAARCNSAFDSSAGSGSLGYFTSNLATPCGPDLIVTHDDCDSTVGQSHWDVYQPLK